jgi:hypothetical protein
MTGVVIFVLLLVAGVDETEPDALPAKPRARAVTEDLKAAPAPPSPVVGPTSHRE